MTSTVPSKKPYRKAPPQHREIHHELPILCDEYDGVILAEQNQEPLTDAERIKLLQHDNEELRRRLAYVTNKMEAMERELESGQDYLEMELGQNREELEKFKDKFRRLQNSYTASQRTNQDLEEKLHALASLSQNWIFAIKKAEMDRKTLDWEIVELTNKLLDAKTTINKLEELNERYRLDCNLAVQLLKCNKSHFRNHKFADLPSELQDMVNKHLQNTQDSVGPGQEELHTLAPSDAVPTSVIARVLEKPESLVLNSAKSSSGSCCMAEDVFVHVDMSGTLPETCVSSGQAESKGKEGSRQQNGSCKPQNCLESLPKEVPTFEKLSPYPTPPPPHPMYPGRKVIEFSEDKVRIPKNSPLPNCTYATRQAISLSLVQGEDENCDRQRPLPSSPASGQRSASSCSYQPSPKLNRVPGSSQSSPFSSPPQVPSTFASSASSEEDLLANWQRMFVDKAPPTTEQVLVNRTAFSRDTAQELQKRFSRSMQELGRVASAYSDGEESVQSYSWTVSRDSSVDIDSTEFRSHRNHFSSDYSTDFSQDESCKLLQGSGTEAMAEPVTSSPEKSKDYIDYSSGSPAEEQELLLQESRVNSQEGVSEQSKDGKSKPPPGRPHRSPKRMGVHHLHRKDSLTQAQEQGNLLT
ncbi:tight junction-associated protein 1-like isoform X3 [Ahaetulla prasina]|uniref:tight junction-associated protein 1-like isoform X3 n=1 Tax=Ahaetulla prasina TaxID=499056 RepID=UPI002648271E|nr:tight junction-associated protein 1-like isoform X3 [Ahaetulla prasina]